MTDRLDQTVSDVRQKAAMLLLSPKSLVNALPPNMPLAGVYVFSEHDKALYVGKSNNLRRRIRYHSGNNHNQATFAFLLARHETGELKASYQKKGSRDDLLTQPIFRRAFDEARERIRQMEVRFIEEVNPVRQALLEIFTAEIAQTRYNDFDNH